MVLSLGLASAGTGTGLILVASHHVKNAGGSTSSGNVVSAGSFLQRKWLRQASPYVSTVNYRASISPLFQLVASPAEYQEVSNLVVAYNSEPLQMKTTGVRVYVSSTSGDSLRSRGTNTPITVFGPATMPPKTMTRPDWKSVALA